MRDAKIVLDLRMVRKTSDRVGAKRESAIPTAQHSTTNRFQANSARVNELANSENVAADTTASQANICGVAADDTSKLGYKT